jgi:hypothetical protein
MPNGYGMSTILFRADAARGTFQRVPVGLAFAQGMELLDRKTLVLLRYDELRVIDVETRQARRLTLPEAETGGDRNLVAGGLAILARGTKDAPVTITVYARPSL